MNIRKEKKEDWYEVEKLTREAFWNVYRPGCTEHLILHNFRKHHSFIDKLSLVVEEEKTRKIIAHIMYCKAEIKDDNEKNKEIAMFGPVSVLPGYQRKGIGCKLIKNSLEKAKEFGYKAVAIVGSSEYYSRFGFESANNFNIYYDDMPRTKETPFFMIKELKKGYLSETVGKLIVLKEYIVSDDDVLEFDKKFPQKVKEKRSGQIGI